MVYSSLLLGCRKPRIHPGMEVACCAQIPAEHRFDVLAAACRRPPTNTDTPSGCSGVLRPPTAAAFDHALQAVLVRATRCPRARAGVRDAAGDVARANSRHPPPRRAHVAAGGRHHRQPRLRPACRPMPGLPAAPSAHAYVGRAGARHARRPCGTRVEARARRVARGATALRAGGGARVV